MAKTGIVVSERVVFEIILLLNPRVYPTTFTNICSKNFK